MFLSNSNNSRARHRAQVVSMEEVAPAHFQIRLKNSELAQAARPGQFVHVSTVPNNNGNSIDPLLRRAFSIMSVDAINKTTIDVLFRVGGRGTQAFATAREGDIIDLIGPLGQPFDISPFENNSTLTESENMFHVKQSKRTAVLVGGGVGVPPLVYLGQTLCDSGIDVHAIIGARNSEEIIGQQELSVACRRVSITTDDGSQGHHGRVTDLLAPALTALIETLHENDRQSDLPIVYACGPLPMLRSVALLCAQLEVKCQVSLEENMPCGIGVCNGCVVRTCQPFATDAKEESDTVHESNLVLNQVVGNEWTPYMAYRRVCVEGPACWADEIDWEYGK